MSERVFYVKAGAGYAPVWGRPVLFRELTPERAAAVKFSRESVAHTYAHLLRIEHAEGHFEGARDAHVVELVDGVEVRRAPPAVLEGAAPEARGPRQAEESVRDSYSKETRALAEPMKGRS